MQVAKLIILHLFGIFLEVGEGCLVILQIVQAVGFGKQTVCIVGVDGDGKLAAGDGGMIVFSHKLRTGEGVPVTGGVGIVINEFVEDPLTVLIFPKPEECTGHQLLEIVGIITL